MLNKHSAGRGTVPRGVGAHTDCFVGDTSCPDPRGVLAAQGGCKHAPVLLFTGNVSVTGCCDTEDLNVRI